MKAKVQQYLPVTKCTQAYVDYGENYVGYDQPIVYVYDMSKARQTIFFTYEQLTPLATREKRIPLRLFSEYFGGGMSSVMFQEVREFRSMAYSTSAQAGFKSLKPNPNLPGCFITLVGTQADKTMSAISLVDSLLRDMPVNEKNFAVAKQERISNIDTEFPSFREIGEKIALVKWLGYTEDPNKGIADLYSKATFDEMMQYYNQNVKNHQGHRVLGIVGNVKKLDMKALEKYGKVVVLKLEDIYRK